MKKKISILALAIMSVSLAACNDGKEGSTRIILDEQAPKSVSAQSSSVSSMNVNADADVGGDDKPTGPVRITSEFDDANKIGFMLNNEPVYPLSLKVVGSTTDTLILSFGSKIPIEKPIEKDALVISHDGVTKSFDHLKDKPMSFEVPKKVLLEALSAEAASLALYIGSNKDAGHSQYYEVDLALEFEGSFRGNALEILQ